MCTTGAIVNNDFMVPDNNLLPIVLDDMGCNGTESNLLECLPNHNCKDTEIAGVNCLLKGECIFTRWLSVEDKMSLN